MKNGVIFNVVWWREGSQVNSCSKEEVEFSLFALESLKSIVTQPIYVNFTSKKVFVT